MKRITPPAYTLIASISAAAMAALFVTICTLGLSFRAMADPDPNQNKFVSGCSLSAATIIGLQNSITTVIGVASPTPQVDFVLVYSLANPNDGQLLSGTAYTGPILCSNGASVNVETTTENTLIGVGNPVTIKAFEEALFLQYEKSDLTIEKRVCHTVADKTYCYLIKPVPPA